MPTKREVLSLLLFLVILPHSLEQALCIFGGCSVDSVGCYTAEWYVNGNGTVLHVELEAKIDGGWLGIGFSETGSLENSDIITGYMKDALGVVEDRFAMAGGSVPVDTSQDVLLGSNGMSGSGFTRITFTRSILSSDTNDISLDIPVYVLLSRGLTLNDTSIEYTWMNVTSKPVNVTDCIFCEVQPCQNNGSCENVNGVYDCVCPKYFTGPLCETLNCDQNTDCSGNGHCNTSFDPSKPAGVSNSICLCERGYNGSNCEIDINECELFGGSKVCGLFPCLNKVGKYECDYCSGAKCQNGATCNPVNATDSTEVTCNCTAAYSGTFCEIEQCIGPVATCNGHGICKADRNTSAPAHVSANPLCLCFGYTGLRCDIFINFCTASPIYGKERCNSVNETCYAIEGGFQCGKPCESNPCFNGGTCAVTSTGIGFMCICPNGAAGLKCETIINPVVTSAHGSSTNTPASSQGLAPTSSSAVKVQITSSPSVLHSVTPTTSPLVVPSLPSAVVPSATAILLSTLFLSSTTVASAVVQIVPSSSTSTVSVPVSAVVQITPSSSTSTVSVPVSASRSAATLLSTSFPFPTTVTSVVVQIPPSSSTSTVSVPVSAVVQVTPSSSTSTVSVPVSASRSAATLLSTSFLFSTTVTSVVVQIEPSSSTVTVSVPVSASRSPVVSNESTTVTQGKVSGITPGTGGHDTTTAFLRTPVPSVQTGEVSGSGDSNTAVIIGVVVGCVVLIAVIIIILFVIALRSQSREGAYSPSQQETKGGASYRVELGNALLPPERERLI